MRLTDAEYLLYYQVRQLSEIYRRKIFNEVKVKALLSLPGARTVALQFTVMFIVKVSFGGCNKTLHMKYYISQTI